MNLVSQFRLYDDLGSLIGKNIIDGGEVLPNRLTVIIREFMYCEFHALKKARMREIVHWWLCSEEKRIRRGIRGNRKTDFSRYQLEMFCARGQGELVLLYLMGDTCSTVAKLMASLHGW